jgi:hypothetical protein
MGRVSASISVPGRASEVEALWYDPVRWPAWVDGFGHVVEVGDGWPGVGSRVVWDAPPGGRGRVVERVVRHEPGSEAVTIELSLEYELKERHVLSWAVDLVSVRPELAGSVRRTLERFARERAADVEWDPEGSR